MQDDHEEQEWGRLFVTRRCCGAATCRNVAPELLGAVAPAQELPGGAGQRRLAVLPDSFEEGAFTGVLRQPRSQADLVAARTAVAACPFGALRLQGPSRERLRELGPPWRDWPKRLEDNVWAVGHPSTKNFGALAYYIAREDGGVLIDPPRPSEALYQWLAEHGGVRWLFLTHRDHTHHHAEFARRFPGCRRILGSADVNLRESEYRPATGDVEFKLGAQLAPLSLTGEPLPEAALSEREFVVLPQPGHTPGSLCLLYRGRFLFSGDHLGYARHLGHPVSPRLQCWEDWERQSRSVRYLATLAAAGHLRFSWLLPGHGEWHRLAGEPSAATTAAALNQALSWMDGQPPGHVPLPRWVLFARSRLQPRSALGRAVRFLGGKGAGSDAWILPKSARHLLPDHDPAKTAAVARRLALLGAAVLGAFGLAWFGARAVRSNRFVRVGP